MCEPYDSKMSSALIVQLVKFHVTLLGDFISLDETISQPN